MERRWIGDGPEDFTFLQWNVLSQTRGNSADFLCPKEHIKLEHRIQLILKEILEKKADLVCLQEIDFFSQLSHELENHDYEGIFVPNPHSDCFKNDENIGPDGTAIFYKRDTMALNCSNSKALTFGLDNGCPSNSILLWADLTHKRTGRKVVVFTTKLKEGNCCLEIRKQQMDSLVSILNSTEMDNKTAVILTGDMSGSPQEPFYQVVRTEANLESAFVSAKGKEAPFTTWARNKSGDQEKKMTEDYIFFSPNTLSPEGVLWVPKDGEFGDYLLPNNQYPSNHLSLVTRFKFITIRNMA